MWGPFFLDAEDRCIHPVENTLIQRPSAWQDPALVRGRLLGYVTLC